MENTGLTGTCHLEHCLRAAQAPAPTTIVIVGREDETAAGADLAAEMRGLAPTAEVRVVSAPEAITDCDLVVLPIALECRFPLEDVVYRDLDRLRTVVAHCLRARWVMIYRLRWRQVDVIPSRQMSAWLLRRRLEKAVIERLRRLARPSARS
jgi:hypothetical protein